MGKDVVFISQQGELIVARPFYFMARNHRSIQMDLYTADGTSIRLVNEHEGVYTLGESGM